MPVKVAGRTHAPSRPAAPLPRIYRTDGHTGMRTKRVRPEGPTVTAGTWRSPGTRSGGGSVSDKPGASRGRVTCFCAVDEGGPHALTWEGPGDRQRGRGGRGQQAVRPRPPSVGKRRCRGVCLLKGRPRRDRRAEPSPGACPAF